MKKIIYILILILIAVYIILVAFGSKGEYASERILYRAMKTAGKIAVNPDVVPPALVTSAEKDFSKILAKYSKTNTAKAAQMALIELYILSKQYDKAIRVIDGVLNNPDENKITLSKALFTKGIVYEKQGHIAEAVKEYKALQDKYPDTPFGIQAPIYIADYYARSGVAVQADKAYNEAVTFYKDISQKNANTILGYIASTLMVQAYIKLDDYEKAGEAVQEIIKDYPSPLAYSQHFPNIELIYIEKLKAPEKAISIYNNIAETTDNAKLKASLKKRIESLKTAKNGS